jgi:hypothetical protein
MYSSTLIPTPSEWLQKTEAFFETDPWRYNLIHGFGKATSADSNPICMITQASDGRIITAALQMGPNHPMLIAKPEEGTNLQEAAKSMVDTLLQNNRASAIRFASFTCVARANSVPR